MHQLNNELNLISLAARHSEMLLEKEELIATLERVEQIQQSAQKMSDRLKTLISKRGHGELYRILLAEDNASQRRLIADALRGGGFFVVEVEDGDQAIEYIHQMTEPDIILTDIAMPNCDGKELISVAKTSPMCPRSLVVAVTGRPVSDEVQQSVDHVIKKPIEPENLVRDLRELLERREAANNSADD